MFCLETLFCLVDNIVKNIKDLKTTDKFLQAVFEKVEKKSKNNAGRKPNLTDSELVTLSILMHIYKAPNVHAFYEIVQNSYELRTAFNTLPHYSQFNAGLNKVAPLTLFVLTVIMNLNKKEESDYKIADSTKLPMCKFDHVEKVKIDEGFGDIGKTIEGWFFGLKLHLIVNSNMDIIQLKFTSGSRDDRSVLTKKNLNDINGTLLADKGYISKLLKQKLKEWGIDILTYHRKNMEPAPLTNEEKKLLSNRKKIEAVNSVNKNCYNLVNKRAKSILGFIRHAIAALAAYSIEKLFRKYDLREVLELVHVELIPLNQ